MNEWKIAIRDMARLADSADEQKLLNALSSQRLPGWEPFAVVTLNKKTQRVYYKCQVPDSACAEATADKPTPASLSPETAARIMAELIRGQANHIYWGPALKEAEAFIAAANGAKSSEQLKPALKRARFEDEKNP